MNYQLQHNALSFIEKHRLFPILINNPAYNSQRLCSALPPRNLQFMENQNQLNAEQIQAIESIENGKYHPFPYLLYGPPGMI